MQVTILFTPEIVQIIMLFTGLYVQITLIFIFLLLYRGLQVKPQNDSRKHSFFVLQKIDISSESDSRGDLMHCLSDSSHVFPVKKRL